MLSVQTYPELIDLPAWLDAPKTRQRVILSAVCAALGPDFDGLPAAMGERRLLVARSGGRV